MIYTLLTTLHMKYNLTLPEIIMAYLGPEFTRHLMIVICYHKKSHYDSDNETFVALIDCMQKYPLNVSPMDTTDHFVVIIQCIIDLFNVQLRS